jgi:hypothetical protein
MLYKFYIPFSYWFATRFKHISGKVSFLIIFVLPVAAVCYTGDISFIASFVIGLVALCCVYEIGYIQNDVYTARKEKSPTIRLDEETQARINKAAPSLIAVRGLYLALSLFALTFFQFNTLRFIIALAALAAVFFLHNTIRNRLNILTYVLLCTLKYVTLPLLFLGQTQLPRLAMLFFIFPFCRTLEHASKPKYNLKRIMALMPNHDTFRVWYYSVLTFLAIVTFPLHDSVLFLALCAWFLLFRLAALYLRSRRSDLIL